MERLFLGKDARAVDRSIPSSCIAIHSLERISGSACSKDAS